VLFFWAFSAMIDRSMIYRFILFLAFALPVILLAQQTETPPPAAVISPENPAAFDPAAATQAWLDTVPLEQRAKSDAYFEGGYWLILWDFLLAAAISIFLLQSGISARLRDFAERATRFKSLQVILYAIPYLILVAILSFPLTVYQEFYREHQYGFATQTFGPWFFEQLKWLVLGLIGVPIGLIILYAVFRRAPRSWWIWAAVMGTSYSMFISVIAPVCIEPIFNTYKPLQDPSIRAPILSMAQANEIPVRQVFIVDASRQTTRVGANVAGLFGTTRIALNDNLLNRCTRPEIREVMAHEMGHYVLNHGGKLTTYFAILSLVGFALAYWLFNVAVAKWGRVWRVRDVADVAGLPLLSLIGSVLVFLATPLVNTITRITEREADVFGINTSREPDGMARVALKLGEYRKLDPRPIEEFIFFDHPSGRARIRMAMDWKAAQLTCGERVGQ
jgi:STE24 endopeptidase